jgi:hypothetical protein
VISEILHTPAVVTYTDEATITCTATALMGIDEVDLVYRIDGSSWHAVDMTHTTGDTYTGTIPAQSWACHVEYVIWAMGLLGSTYVDDNDGLCYSYLVADLLDPEVSITAPAADASVSGMVTISVTTSDAGSGIDRVEFYVDGSLIGTDDSAPFELEWDSSEVSDGAHTLMVRAFDGAGNDAEASITLTTDNPTTTTTTDGIPPDTMMIVVVIGGAAVVIIIVVIILRKRE